MTDLRMGTVTAVGAFSAWRLVDDLDGATALPINVWTLPNAPTVNDRVLYQVVQGQVVVLANLTSPYRTAAGVVAVTIATANVTATAGVTFPAGLFTSNPIVVPQIATGVTSVSTTPVAVWASAVSTSGATINVNRANTTTTSVVWHAIEV